MLIDLPKSTKLDRSAAKPATTDGSEAPRANYFNRDVSLLAFFKRVLDEARDQTQPLLERLKFLSILSSNLDEFFMIRVSGLKEKLGREVGVARDGYSTTELLAEIRTRISEMVSEQMDCLRDEIIPELSLAGIVITEYYKLSESQRRQLDKYFHEAVYPLLTPQAVDPTHPFPYISGGSINLGLRATPMLDYKAARGFENVNDEFFVRIKIPPSLPRFISVDGTDNMFVFIEDLIQANVDLLVPEAVKGSCHAFRITRDGDLEVREAETEDLLEAMEQNLKLRRFGDVIRLEVATSMPPEMVEYLTTSLKITGDDIYTIEGPLNVTSFWDIYGVNRPDLKDRPIRYVNPTSIESAESTFAAIKKQDVLLHHPYMPYSTITNFIREAVEDPDV
ncbi:MAG: RNA degradosome polyphosphate kinase, partial [Pyrinomonadaceae bacterium]